MKDKILVFIIGLLLGAVITAAGFLAFEKVNKNNMEFPEDGRMQMMERPDGEKPNGEAPAGMPEGMQERNQNDGTRPERPDDNSKENSKTL